MRFSPRLTIPPAGLLLAVLLFVSLQSGCAARTVRSPIINRFGVHVDLVREEEGFTTRARDFEHPAIVSTPRLQHILGAIEIESPSDSGGSVRQPAFHPEIIEPTALALAEALAKASPDQEVGVQIIRRQKRMGVLHEKYLTTFLAYIDNGYLYLTLRRVDFFVPKGRAEKNLPKPRRSDRSAKFRVVSGEPLFYAGPQTLEIAWRDPAFNAAFQLPGSTQGKKRRRQVLLESPVSKAERDAANRSPNSLGIEELSADQLRALANLEEDRQNGLITETAYQRARRELLRRR